MKKTTALIMLIPVLVSLLLASCTMSEKPIGSKENPIKFYFTPSSDAEEIANNSKPFMDYLQAETGFYFKSAVPTSYVAVVESFGSNRADIAVMNSFGYLMANEKFGSLARLSVLRNGEQYYRGMIIANTNSGITKVEDIKGKKFAYTDSASTSGYFLPKKMLKERNVEPGNTIFAMKHDIVVTMVYQGQVDAGAAYYSPPAADGAIRDARIKVKTQFPNVEDKVKIIELTEEIKNDPVVFRKDLPKEVVDKVIAAILKYLSTEEGKATFKKIYDVDGLVVASDADYDNLRKLIKENDLKAEEFLNKKK